MTGWWLVIAQAEAPISPVPGAGRTMLALLAVLALFAALAWALARGQAGPLARVLGRRVKGPVVVEPGASLGERRSLVIVSVEGRRMLLALTPAGVSVVTELAPGPPGDAFARTLDRQTGQDMPQGGA